jgi:thiamine monophosphate synthase
MADKPPPHELQPGATLDAGARATQRRLQTLEPNEPAKSRLVEHTLDYYALLINEADQIARRRGGDGIQSGDVDQAKESLESKTKASYWSLMAGSALLGAGLAGLAESLLSAKGIAFIIVYFASIVLGLIFLYFAAPKR